MTISSGADFAQDEAHRWSLWRTWNPDLPKVAFCMLNPSTADATKNDPTVERCQRRAVSMGYGGLIVVNLFAFRATDPRAMKRAADPVGKLNDEAIVSAARTARTSGGKVVCAWGTHGDYLGRGAHVRSMLGYPLYHLGLTRGGSPRHPLYVSYLVEPKLW